MLRGGQPDHERLAAMEAQGVEIPHRELSESALRGVVESYVLREGTDYGHRNYSLEEKIAAVMRQLDRGEAAVVFDPETETVDIVETPPSGRRARPEGSGRDQMS